MAALLHALRTFVLDPGGGWAYPYVQHPSPEAVLVALCMICGVIALGAMSESEIKKREATVVVTWLSAGLFATMMWRSLVPYRLEAVIRSAGANAYYSVATEYSVHDLLSNYAAVFAQLPAHVRSNMPGKTLLYELFLSATDSFNLMAWLIALISTVGGGLLMYVFARQLYADRRVALYALVFYLVQPSRAYFFPLLNTVTPTVALLVVVLVMQFLNSPRAVWAIAIGIATYVLTLFDPLALVVGLPLLLLLARAVAAERLRGSQVVRLAAYALGSLVAVHVMVVATVHFDLIEAFVLALDDSRRFHVDANRPYTFWVFHNLKDFFLHIGVVQSFLWFSAVIGIAAVPQASRRFNAKELMLRNDVVPVVSFTATLLLLNFSGIALGETVRHWIFLGAFFQLLAARECAARWGSRAFALACAVSILQGSILLSTVGWVIP